jgi:hypothetical protein
MLRAQIYVRLPNEGVDVWRPVDASHLQGDVYRINTESQHPQDEEWEFDAGELVHCRERTFSGGTVGLVAFERANLIRQPLP